MKKLSLPFIFLMFPGSLFAQVTELPPTTTEQQLENITANNADVETEDDAYLQEMAQFLENPVNLNTADENMLKELALLSPFQVHNLLLYRSLLGKLISIYELQAVPGWDLQTIRTIQPYITVSYQTNVTESIRKRLSAGEHSLLLRATQVLERSKGYLTDPATGKNYYAGSPQKILFRYKYAYKNLLQYGILAEKDAGEQFFKGNQKSGFDFYSAHIFIRNLGIIRSLALGDFTVNMGQGLTQWQGLAFKKSPDITGIKRQSTVLRPYNSAGEINFHRGIGITLSKGMWEATVFGSYRKLDANFIAADSITNEDIVSSLQSSGYHRTASEIADKHIQQQIAVGGNIAFQFSKLHVSVNGIKYRFKYPLIKDPQPYNAFALSGKSFGNYSVDYSYTFRNMHIFGELATTGNRALAFVNGLLISVSDNADLSFLYRNISPKYQSLYTNAFTEGTYPTNEKGLFSGISMRPLPEWQVDAFIDLYKFPWLKYRVDAPTNGSDYFIQLSYRPNKLLEIYSHYKRGSKAINYNPDQQVLNPLVYQPKQDWRVQLSYKINPQFSWKSRTELIWFDKKGGAASNGFLLYVDLVYKPLLKPFSASIRLEYFETDDYNSRVYAYEDDVLYSFSIPVSYGKGYRYFLNLNYDFTKRMAAWARIAQTIYPGLSSIGSGLDEINGNRKTEVKIQLMYRF